MQLKMSFPERKISESFLSVSPGSKQHRFRKIHAYFNALTGNDIAENRVRMQTPQMQLSADQIVEETSDWPEDAVADLVDRILRAKYGEVDPSVDDAWRVEIHRRIAEMESGTVRGIPLEETLAKARKLIGQ